VNPDIPLHDIRPLVDVPDNSIWFFSAVVLVSIIILIALTIFIIRFFKKSKNQTKILLEELKNIDTSNSKEAAYSITHLGELLLKKSTSPELFENLTQKLEPFKYRKEVPALDERTIELYNLYVESINA